MPALRLLCALALASLVFQTDAAGASRSNPDDKWEHVSWPEHILVTGATDEANGLYSVQTNIITVRSRYMLRKEYVKNDGSGSAYLCFEPWGNGATWYLKRFLKRKLLFCYSAVALEHNHSGRIHIPEVGWGKAHHVCQCRKQDCSSHPCECGRGELVKLKNADLLTDKEHDEFLRILEKAEEKEKGTTQLAELKNDGLLTGKEHDDILRILEIAEEKKEGAKCKCCNDGIVVLKKYFSDPSYSCDICNSTGFTYDKAITVITNPENPQLLKAVVKNLKEEVDTLKEERLCKVCYSNPVEFALHGCGHIAICGECLPKLVKNECPMCRTQIEKEPLRIHLS